MHKISFWEYCHSLWLHDSEGVLLLEHEDYEWRERLDCSLDPLRR